ncbi:glycosyltransferase family 2 protein [Ruegeria arenilitoris]|uniref:glycosyltransferase family 2 protein n=1 Tax=Ruegeria arenilitoris TaxID=1173585 RepID=UPI00147FADF7|nr:glycosyltransferase family A protein [Ruegeria arenilitoris]
MSVPISIGLPVYNGEKYIDDAIRSLRAQTFADLEIVISDNASTDSTRDICLSHAAEDDRIRYHCQDENVGAAGNYNETVRRASGRYFKWAAHDDMIAPTFLERCFERLEDDPRASIAFTRMREVDADGQSMGDYSAPIVWNGRTAKQRLESLLCSAHDRTYIRRCVPITGLMRADMLRRTRLIGRFNHSDKVTLVEMALLGDFIEVPEYLFFRRMHGQTSVAANSTPQALAAWFDPSRRTRFVLPRSRLFMEFGRAVLRADIPVQQRMECLSPLTRLLRRDWRVFGGEIKQALVANARPSGTAS